MEVAATQRQYLLDQWVPEALVDLRSARVALEEVAFAEAVEDSTVLEAGAVLVAEVASKTEDEGVLVTKAGEGLAGTAAGLVAQMVTEPLLPVLLLDLVADAVEVVSEEVMVVLDPQIEMAPLPVVGMIRALVVAHMMTEMAGIVAAAVAMEIAMDLRVVEVAATWSR